MVRLQVAEGIVLKYMDQIGKITAQSVVRPLMSDLEKEAGYTSETTKKILDELVTKGFAQKSSGHVVKNKVLVEETYYAVTLAGHELIAPVGNR